MSRFISLARPGLIGVVALAASIPALCSQPYANTPEKLVPYREARKVYRRLYEAPPVYRGPGREEAPASIEGKVRIGLMLPASKGARDEAGGDLLRGVELAIEEANANGPNLFELVKVVDKKRWGSSANTLVKLAYEDRVAAVIGSMDSTSAHVALRAAFKAELPIVDAGATDPTLTETGIPWIIRTTQDDRQVSYRLARYLFQERGLRHVAILRESGRYGRVGVVEFIDASRRIGKAVVMEELFDPGARDVDVQVARLAASKPEAIVIWAKAGDAARLVKRIRGEGIEALIALTPRAVAPIFLRKAARAAEGVVAASPTPFPREDSAWTAFRERYETAFRRPVSLFAAHGYDAARLVIRAVQEAGPNRAKIMDYLLGLKHYRGVAGAIEFDATGNDIAPLALVTVEGGRFVSD